MRPNEHYYLKNIVKTLPENLESTSDYLFLANISVAVQETLYFKLKQIDRTEYNWLTESVLENCKVRLDNIIGKDCENGDLRIEETIIHSGDDVGHKFIDEFLAKHFGKDIQFRFTARVDLITEDTLWELKCTTKISIDHLLQLAIYAWLWKMYPREDKERKFNIFNIRTNERLSLNATLEDLNTIIVILLKGKFQKQEIKTDEEFIKDCVTVVRSN